jgi:hypothetical protein
VFEPGASVAGRSPSQLAGEWWQWALGAPDASNPVSDQTGDQCGYGQDGPVWFLAGAFGSFKVRRVCKVPAGKVLFFPVINRVMFTQPRTSYTCEEARLRVEANNDRALELFAELDGVAIENVEKYRASSDGCFETFARILAVERPYPFQPAAASGFWLSLEPLSPGRHTLKFGGKYPGPNRSDPGRFVQDIEYELVVE